MIRHNIRKLLSGRILNPQQCLRCIQTSNLSDKPEPACHVPWSQYNDRPLNEPIESTSVILFPGQGSQFVGMARNLLNTPGVKDMFEYASSVLRTDLLKTCIEGPTDKLQKTIHCQPAIYVTSLAALKRLKFESPELVNNCVATAGYSVGEVMSLVLAGSFSFEEGLHIIRVRAECMQRASELTAGSMCSIQTTHQSQLQAAISAAIQHCKDELHMKIPLFCGIASYISADCKVIAGNVEALAFIEEHSAQFRLGRVKRLSVAGAFHTPLMNSATGAFRSALKKISPPRTPLIPVISNVNAEPYGHGSGVIRRLVNQIAHPLHWEQTLHALYARPQDVAFPQTIEIGPGRQMGAMLRMVNKKAYERYKAIEV